MVSYSVCQWILKNHKSLALFSFCTDIIFHWQDNSDFHLNLNFSHLIILFSFQYVGPSHPSRPRTQRGNNTSQHETYKSTYFTLRRTLEGRRRIPSIFPATPLSSLRASARIQNIFWDMSHIKQQPLGPMGSQPYSSNPRPQQNNSNGGSKTTDNKSKRKDLRKRQSNQSNHYKFSIKPPSKK